MSDDKDDILSPESGTDDEFGGLDGDIEGLDSNTQKEPLETNVVTHNHIYTVPNSSNPEKSPEGDEQEQEVNEDTEGQQRKGRVPKEAKTPKKEKVKKEEKKPLTKREKAIRVMLRRAGKEEIPDISELMRGKDGKLIAISEIALFNDTSGSELMAELAKECISRNRVNLSAEVVESRVIHVGAQIIKAGRMYSPIQVVKIAEDGALECVSGRHRLAFLALVYGADSKIPVHIEHMSLNEARDAVVVANEARPTKALERAEHAVMQAVGGDIDAEQDDMYAKTVKTRYTARKYCVYNVMKRKYPLKLGFKVSQTSSRRDGGLTTLTNVENFWGAALEWSQELERKKFDASLKDSVRFLNEFAQELQKYKDFNPDSHMSSMAMIAVGKYYRVSLEFAGKNAIEVVASLAKQVVKMGDIGRQKSEKTYKELSAMLKPK